MGTYNPETGSNHMLDHFYPIGFIIAALTFLVYSIVSGLLILGVKKDKRLLTKLFLVGTILTISLCLCGHCYIFLGFHWYETGQLVFTLAFNVFWYIWWIYCFLIVLNFYIEDYIAVAVP